MKIEVKGHSGCQVDVVNEDGHIFVYKSTSDPKYLNRLVLQAQKQETAGGVEYQHIRVPHIYSINKTEEQTIVKMQYVYSKNFIEFFEQAGFEQVEYLIGALKTFIEYEISKSVLQSVPATVFQLKFDEIQSKIQSNLIFQSSPNASILIDKCKAIFYGLEDMRIPLGICHGDLTFSNILFNGNNYYLIDFLDSFIETPLQDIVKIRQDTAYHWSQLMYTKPYDAIRLQIILNKIDKEVDDYFSKKYDWYNANYHIVQLMNILRIVPYAKEKKVINHLQMILNSILNEIV